MTVVPKEAFRPTPNFRAQRSRGLARVSMIDAAGDERPVMVGDVSARGLSATAHGPAPALGAMVAICLPGGRMAWGVVRWVEGVRFGVEFDTALDQPARPR